MRRQVPRLAMAGLAAAAAVISYNDGLFLVRLAGTGGRLAYLYPLLPDGLIVIAAQAWHAAVTSGQDRPRWATAGVALGAVLTLAQNVGAGAVRGPLLACVDGVVPVVFFVSMEIFIGHVRSGQSIRDSRNEYPVTETAEPPTTEDALRVLLDTGSLRGLGTALGVPKSRVEAWQRKVAASPEPVLSLNGDGPHG